MSQLRRLLFTALPKVFLSRACGGACALPLPRWARSPIYGWFARRYGASLDEMDGELSSFRSMQDFFRRPLRAGARPIASAPLVWPCDGRVVGIGPVANGRIEQIKGRDYSLADLLGDEQLAAALDGGEQATIYLAPGDYHRVHAPFAGEVERVEKLRGTLFPVNPSAVRTIDRLFVRNSRHVFHCRLASGQRAAVVMVGAYNVGDTHVTVGGGGITNGQEIGRFGFGSTVVVVLPREGPRFRRLPAETRVRVGEAADGAAGS